MKEPIVYNKVEKRIALRRGIPLLATMWDIPAFRAQWRTACQRLPCPYVFHAGFIDRVLPPLWGTNATAPVRPHTGLCHAPGHLRTSLLIPDATGRFMHQLPWYLYGRAWQQASLQGHAPTMVKAQAWDLLGIGREPTYVKDGWWRCDTGE